jgi:hypothetical protein
MTHKGVFIPFRITYTSETEGKSIFCGPLHIRIGDATYSQENSADFMEDDESEMSTFLTKAKAALDTHLSDVKARVVLPFILIILEAVGVDNISYSYGRSRRFIPLQRLDPTKSHHTKLKSILWKFLFCDTA